MRKLRIKRLRGVDKFEGFDTQRLRKKLRVRLIFLLLACFVLSMETKYLTGSRTTERETGQTEEEEPVLSDELAGYLQIIPFSPEETRAWILPEMGTYLTGSDVDYIFEYLGIPLFAEAIQEKIPYEKEEEISRLKWCMIYEEMAEYLGFSDQIQVVTIQYLGILADEERLMADNGDYDCDADSLNFTYGESYEVYIYGNVILGRFTDTAEAMGDAGQEGAVSSSSVEISVPKTVRVLVTQDNNESIYRDAVQIMSTTGLRIRSEDEDSLETDARTMVNCTDLMEKWETGELIAEPEGEGKLCITNSEGSAVSAWYEGAFYLYKDNHGVWIVNEVELEDYLCGVVPGEMPESFEKEALMAQAICARTYACFLASQERYSEYNADFTDTTDCQVYLPSKENEKSSQAVADTSGTVLGYEGYLANIYYFSTSCGYTSGPEVWQMEEIDYLPGVSLLMGDYTDTETDFDSFLRDTEVSAYDSASRYFRWQARVDIKENQESIKKTAEEELQKGTGKIAITSLRGETKNDVQDLGDYVGLSIAERTETGMVSDLRIEFTGGYLDIFHENMIRTILGLAMTSLTDKNGNSVYTLDMLPSAAFSVDCMKDGSCRIYGGGLGHGIGMSQYGANGMAEAGMNCSEILTSFFPGTEVTCTD